MKATSTAWDTPAAEHIQDALPADLAIQPTSSGRRLARFVGFLFGWLWRLNVGVLLCLNYFTSILVVGFLYRWMQGQVLRGWWKKSKWARQGTFEDFCRGLGPDAAVSRPRWLLPERLGEPRAWVPTRFALWLNCKRGVQALFCTYLLTGWPCLLMLGSWEFGWLNSFNKGYEQAWIGPASGFLGIFLFVAAMVYVPMAQVHQAVTGDYRAFFDFRFVWRLINARPLAYSGLAMLFGLAGLILEGLKTAPEYFDALIDSNATNSEVFVFLQRYLYFCCWFLFPVLLLTRFVASRIYRTAVLRVLKEGWVSESELHPTLNSWLERLDLKPALPKVSPQLRWGAGSLAWWLIGAVDLLAFVAATAALGIGQPAAFLGIAVVWVIHWTLLGVIFLFRQRGLRRYVAFSSRRVAFGLLFWLWFGFIAKVYVAEFLNYHPFVGFMNHALVQFPCFDFVPSHLW